MNARSHVFELSVEGRQIEEVVASIFHSLFLHRTLGKFHYKQENRYTIGTLGWVDEDCDFVDFTYVKVASEQLDTYLKREIAGFRDALRDSETGGSGQIMLEFFEKKRAWVLPDQVIPWEIWIVKLDVITLANERERQICREKVGEVLGEKIVTIAEIMNRHEIVPKMPNQSDSDSVFDTRFTDIQPYLNKISYQTTGSSTSSVGTAMRKFIKDTLAL